MSAEEYTRTVTERWAGNGPEWQLRCDRVRGFTTEEWAWG